MSPEVDPGRRPYIVGLGGSARPHSTSAAALRAALGIAERMGAQTEYFNPGETELPLYQPHRDDRCSDAMRWLEAVGRADGLIICTPGYHGTIAASVKNWLDYLDDFKPTYLDGRVVGCIACSYGDQAAPQALTDLRSVVHALRAWPTPLGVTLNGYFPTAADEDGELSDEGVLARLELLCTQVVTFARTWPRTTVLEPNSRQGPGAKAH